MLVLQAPLTPYSASIPSGPPPAAPNRTAQPLPSNPNPALGSTSFLLDLAPANVAPSIPIPANLLGISIELSVADEYLGSDPQTPSFQFLNYLANIRARAGVGPIVRIGGNTQDTAEYASNLDGIIRKVGGGLNAAGIPITPHLVYSDVIFQSLKTLVNLTDARIVWGVNMVNNTADFTLDMVEHLQKSVGDSLEHLLVGNEPDRYALTGNRPASYSIDTYLDELGALTQSIINAAYADDMRQFSAPSVCCSWTTSQILDAGMRSRFSDRLKAISAIKYPQSLCQSDAVYGHAGYLNMTNIVDFAMYDVAAVSTAVEMGLPYVLAETNTASCVGVAGVSDTFTSALWAITASLELAYRNHSAVLLHNGGANVLYNVFHPPTRNTTTTAWRTAPIYYSLIVLAEALRSTSSERSRVRNLGLNETMAAAYGVYEEETPVKLVLVNMASSNDQTQVMNVEFDLPANGNAAVSFKTLTAASVDEKANITWAGQTLSYYSDGTLIGTEDVQTLACPSQRCTLRVPAPSVILVFLTQQAQSKASVSASAFEPQGTNNRQLVLDSNGSRGNRGGSTSKGSTRRNAGCARTRARPTLPLLAVLAPLFVSLSV
ncbi:Glycoside hydrolase, superfamily [Ceraceosorus bombacis]|uniref:Glycoside hydrolase, superfamily n=1 Tax=Ceraceosorus bombacis TaxID=401625 RepID=A0A0P1BK53_9BASI|nr:Glycoside hydrolase, superfamily [Ceraceosorus bombacis]